MVEFLFDDLLLLVFGGVFLDVGFYLVGVFYGVGVGLCDWFVKGYCDWVGGVKIGVGGIF